MPVDLSLEASRNQVLRRADWRFLLPQVRPAQSICFANGLLAQAVSAISDRVVNVSHGLDGQCDLAVVVDPDRATMQSAWSALRPGGWCYSEWYSPLAGGVPRIRQRLQIAGFEDVQCYWPWPWPRRGSAQFWLPLEAPALVNYFLQQRALLTGFKRRATFAARQVAWRMIDRLGMQRPVCALACKPGPALAGENNWPSYLRAQWANLGLGSTPDRLYRLLLTGGQHSLNKVVGLIAAARDAAPQVAVKMPRVPAANAALKHEATILQTVHQRRPNLPGIPRVLFCLEQGSAVVVGESVLSGVPLYTRLRAGSGHDNYRSLAVAATDWLIELAGRPALSSKASWWQRLIESPLAEFEDHYSVLLEREQIDRTRASLRLLGDLALVCEQRDFSPWNVLIDADGKWIVLDWESAEADGLPAHDLIYFLAYLAFFRDGAMESGQYRESYRRLLDPQTSTGAVFAECLARYAAQVGIDPVALKPLRLLTWMLHTRSEYQRMAAESGGQPTAGALRQSLFISLWEEELAKSAGRVE